MSDIEILVIAFTMLLATGMIRCLDGIYHAAVSPRRYWIPQVLLWSTFIFGFNFMWGYRDNLADPSPSYIFYASSVALASTFVLRAYILATSDPAKIEDWALHFQKIARPYFIVSFLGSLSSLAIIWSTGESSGLDAVSIPFWLGVVLNATGAIFKKLWIRGAIAVIHISLVTIASYILLSNDLL